MARLKMEAHDARYHDAITRRTFCAGADPAHTAVAARGLDKVVSPNPDGTYELIAGEAGRAKRKGLTVLD